jgi:hypothetical protein
MKRIALATVALGAAAAAGYATYPNEFRQYADAAAQAARSVGQKIEANPVPVYLALGTFLLTVVYHKARGKSLRESVEVATTRVAVVEVPREGVDAETPVVRRAKARATRAQLLADQIGLQNRQRQFPEAVQKAEKEACYTEQAVAEAERTLAGRRKAHEVAVAKLEGVRKEKAVGDAELAEIETELKKLAEKV